MAILLLTLMLLVVQALLRGPEGGESFIPGVTFCSPFSWVVFVLYLLLNIGVVVWGFNKVKHEQLVCEQNNVKVLYKWGDEN